MTACCPPGCCGTETTTIYRRYYTRAERVKWLEGYAAELETELAAVKERIKDVGAA